MYKAVSYLTERGNNGSRAHQSVPAMCKKQTGAVLIETAMVFPLFFAVVWATLGYALPFFMLQTMNHATEEAVRTAVRADPLQGSSAYRAKLISLADAALTEKLSSLPASMENPLVHSVTVQTIAGAPTLVVRVSYPDYDQNPIIPILTLPGVGPVPNLSGDLMAESRYRLESGG